MTKEEAEKIHLGDIVLYMGKPCRVTSVKTSGIASPHFRLSHAQTGKGVENGELISWKLCSLPDPKIARKIGL